MTFCSDLSIKFEIELGIRGDFMMDGKGKRVIGLRLPRIQFRNPMSKLPKSSQIEMLKSDGPIIANNLKRRSV